jgi:hypothetical protein
MQVKEEGFLHAGMRSHPVTWNWVVVTFQIRYLKTWTEASTNNVLKNFLVPMRKDVWKIEFFLAEISHCEA